MDDEQSFQRFAGVASILAAVCAVLSFVLFFAIPSDSGQGLDAMNLLKAGPDSITVVRLSMFTQMLGYYLLLLPVALVLQRWLGSRRPSSVQFYTVCGLIYIVTGALGTTVLMGAFPDLMRGFAGANGSLQTRTPSSPSSPST